MQGFSSKLTAYDFLGMLVPGIVVMFCVCYSYMSPVLFESRDLYCCGCKVATENSFTFFGQALILIIFGGLSYLAGLVINSVSGVIWRGLRNDECALNYTYNKIMSKSGGYYHLGKLIGKDLSAVTGQEPWPCMAIGVYLKQFLIMFVEWMNPYKRYPEIEHRYYEAYYWLDVHKHISTSSVIESQINFMRNMIIPIILLCITFSDCKYFMYSAIIMLVLIFIVMIARQNKVYELIWENYHWYKQIDENEKSNNSNNR